MLSYLPGKPGAEQVMNKDAGVMLMEKVMSGANAVRLFMKRRLKLSNTQIIVLGFMLTILAGSVLLSLPVATRSGQTVPYVDALFTATTATCVTGLVVYDTFTQWSLFGQLVILALIQVGGLGFMTIATLFSLMLRRTISYKERMVLSESISLEETSGVVRLIRHVLLGTLLFEGLGAVILAIRFIPDFGFASGVYKGIFHAVSAFCNAGIDLMGESAPFRSLMDYQGDWIVNLTIMALIVIGGLGFYVWEDIYRCKNWRDLHMHSKLVILMTLVLIFGGALLFFLMEFQNPNTLQPMPWHTKILASLFQSVTPRTAGFNTLDLPALTTASTFLTMLLMFIGGAPGSTAGGIKITTLGMLIFTAISTMRGAPDVNAFHRRLETQAIKRAITILLIGIGVVCVGIMVISACEPHLTLQQIAYEVISAFGTVGLTLGITPTLGTVSKLVLILLMYFGRVGVLTIMLSLTIKSLKSDNVLRYPKGKILI